MDADELDHEINELDHRLDRLRSLYEQYFLGIERIEPAVARKDVDRRFWMLRKIKIRNTARRFRLQTLIQRYNTFQQHWTRICREIENGTYKRQLLRAERRQGPSAAHDRDSMAPPTTERGEAARAASDAAAADLESLFDADLDLAVEAKRALNAVLQSRPPPANFKPDEAPTQRRVATRSVAPLEKLELDDFDLGGSASKPARSPTPRLAPPALPTRTPARPTSPPPVPSRPPGPTRPAATPDPASRPAAVARVVLKRVAVPARGITEAPPPVLNSQGNRQPPPSASAPRAAAAPAAQPGSAFRSAIGGSGRAADIFGPPAVRPKAASAPSAQPSAGLTEVRVKQLHAKLVAAKSQLNDQGQVSVGGLQRQLAASYEKLQAKHRGRQIDFDVVVKDGKAVVKPKIR